MGLKRVAECIRKNKQFLITSHLNPEGDAIGSELAFCHLLKTLKKKAIIVNEDPLPYGYDFLPQAETIKRFGKKTKNIKFDCLVAVDCSDLRRTGELSKLPLKEKTILNVDHHISNEKFGDVNWVEPNASSCAEMVYKIYKEMGVAFNRDSATQIYVGIVTDTGSFKYSNTSPLTHRAAAQLLKYGLDVYAIYKKSFENIPFSDIQFLSRILPTMKRLANGKIAWFKIKREMLRHKKFFFDLSEHILSFGRAIKDVEVVVLFKENLGDRGQVRVNFRSQGKVDVNKIARIFGGGGHKTASGATIKGNIDDISRKVLAKIQDEILKK